MVEDIDIYNVKFGDCFILKNNSDTQHSNKLLVDFGSIQSIDPPVIKGVNIELARAESKYLMITHFHSDHYKGIKTLNNNIIFDEIYLPDYFSRNIIKLQFTLLSLLNERHPAYQIAYNLLSAIPNIFRHLNCNSKIIFVKRGDLIFNNLDSFRILWPKVDDFDRLAHLLFREVIDYYNLGEDYENYIESLTERYFSLLPETREHEGNGHVLKFEDLEFRAERIRQIEAEIERVSNETNKPRKRLRYVLSNKIRSCQNEICICFDNLFGRNIPKNKRVLFLSDICRENLQTIIGSEDNSNLALSDYYRVIKVPHHGTKDYFVPNLTLSEYMIVPNGYAIKPGWEITALYGEYYKERNFICADFNACENSHFFRYCRACCRNNCICGFYPHYCLYL